MDKVQKTDFTDYMYTTTRTLSNRSQTILAENLLAESNVRLSQNLAQLNIA
jgi:hypothetical protein